MEVLSLLRPIVENSKVALTVVDLEGNLWLFNAAAERLTGYRREEVVGKPITLFYRQEEELRGLLARVMEDGKVEDYETILVGKGGLAVPVSILVTLLHDDKGQVIGTLGITIDIADRKQLEQSLLEAKRQADFYNDLMCHDIRNFSQTAMGYLQLLLGGRYGEFDGEQRRLLQICLRQLKRTRNLIDRVRTLTEFERGKREELTPISLSPVIEEAIKAVEDLFPERRITIHLEIPQDATVIASPILFELLFNLISNGVSHNNQSQPEIWIEVSKKEHDRQASVEISVADNGPGVGEKWKTRVFERFESCDLSGSGIGLSLVKAMVDHYQGAVWIEDRITGEPGSGARFVLRLRGGAP